MFGRRKAAPPPIDQAHELARVVATRQVIDAGTAVNTTLLAAKSSIARAQAPEADADAKLAAAVEAMGLLVQATEAVTVLTLSALDAVVQAGAPK